MTIGIEAVIAAISDWRGRQVEVELLAGGLTNVNYAATVDGQRMFVRVPGEVRAEPLFDPEGSRIRA
jgi:hypothetical protein